MAKKRANGEGNIRKRADGRWEGRYTAGYHPETGKRIIKNVLGKTQAECKAKLSAAMEAARGIDVSRADEYTVAIWLRSWYEIYAKPNIRISTANRYQLMVEQYTIPRIGSIKLTKLTSHDLQKLYKDLMENGRIDRKSGHGNPGLSSTTVRSLHLMLHNAFERAVKERLIPRNPTEDCIAPKVQKIEMQILSPEHIKDYAYLLVPSDGYKARVPAGWLSLLVNAGDGIDLDVFLTRQPKDRMVRKLGQQLRINRSKIKETSDTNTDFDDLDGAIRSGYFLKDGLSNNEDFYYLNLLITVTAGSVDDLEWKVAEMKKLLLSQDMDVQTCSFCQEQAFLSSLPLVSLERQLYERSKRNVLTTGAASCYPFTSYEMCDDNGILLGVNKHNNSLIIVDIFDSRVYKNANIAILGTSGAGKTFTLQLMALRMRRKGIQVFIIAPLKGHEFHRACSNIGGQFISISPASQNCINIMEIRKADKSVDDLLDGPGTEKSLLAAKIQRLHTFFSLLNASCRANMPAE